MPDGSEKSAVVVYSLGNFISNQRKEHTDGGILFQVGWAAWIRTKTDWVRVNSATVTPQPTGTAYENGPESTSTAPHGNGSGGGSNH